MCIDFALSSDNQLKVIKLIQLILISTRGFNGTNINITIHNFPY